MEESVTTHCSELELAGRTLKIETGKMARLTNGSALVQYGDTVVLSTATCAPTDRDFGFFPLTIDYRERTSAAGKFPGGFFKREGPPTTKEIITMRMIDRPTRPLFPKTFKGMELQIQTLVLSADQEIDPDICAMIGSSTALSVSDIPFLGPLGSVRIGRAGGEFLVNPTIQAMAESELDLVVCGTEDAITMVEASAKEVPEAIVLDALELAHEKIRELCAFQNEIAAQVGKEKMTVPEAPASVREIEEEADTKYFAEIRTKIQAPNKKERRINLKEIKDRLKAEFGPNPETGEEGKYTPNEVRDVWSTLEKKALREIIVQDGHRVDGRRMDEVRSIHSEVNLLPRAHGSALFTRGETQALVSITLGTTRDEQKIDGLLAEPFYKAFLLHYNFPPFCVGEVRAIRGPSRREIGHGMLAERALCAVLPDAWGFPYTIRVVSDVLESNGSSSMASVCGGTLAMLDAGVPLLAPVAGIAMGLVKEGDEVRILSDILGDEDHCGDMDFKVAGSERGMTAMQMDCKVAGVGREIMVQALEQARQGRMYILGEMNKTLSKARSEVSIFAPSACKIPINPEKIGLIVGAGGRTIKALQADSGAQIEISDEGVVAIYCSEKAGMEMARNRIEGMLQEPEVGEVYEGRVTSIKPFGAFVEILPGQEGLVHISELASGFVDNVRDVVKEGEIISVKVLSVEDDRVRLSRKALEKKEEVSEPSA